MMMNLAIFVFFLRRIGRSVVLFDEMIAQDKLVMAINRSIACFRPPPCRSSAL
jgi:hypothetical protein